jgi:hypothetical protein
MRVLLLIAAAGAGLTLSACISNKQVWSYYDACSGSPSFVEMVDCGKRTRNAECQAANGCSGPGNNFVAYAEALAGSVRSREISENEARRKLIEFRTTQEGQMRQERQSAAAIAAAAAPVTCTTTFGVTTCY